MTELLEKAFTEASALPAEQQDLLGEWILAELESEGRWDEAFSGSANKLAQMARAALQEHEEGRTEELDPDRI